MKYFLVLCFLTNMAFAEPVVIVNANNSVTSIDADEASDIFLKKQTRFSDGVEATPVNLKEGTKLRDEFYDKAAAKSPAQLRAYWAKSVFTGNKAPPKEFDSTAEIKEFVANNPNGIAYIDKSEVDESVKVVMTVQ